MEPHKTLEKEARAVTEGGRYNRQQLIEGWNQRKLSEARVTIIGSGALAQYTAIPLVALGIGNVCLLDNALYRPNEQFLDFPAEDPQKYSSRVQFLEERLQKLNPHVKVDSFALNLSGEASKYFLERSSLVIDATNNPNSKAIAVEYAQETKTPLIVTSCQHYHGTIRLYLGKEGRDARYLLPQFQSLPQESLVSMILGGAIAEEVKKVLMGEKEAQLLRSPSHYNFRSRERFTRLMESDMALPLPTPGEFSEKKVLMVGAGALGNFVGLGLAQLGIGQIDIIDPDRVDDHNLNRQILYYDSVGRDKALALTEKLSKISGGKIKVRGLVDKFTEKTELGDYDAIFDCVDSFVVRAVINDYALSHGLPLISGGTDYQAGQVAVCVPGKTGCLDCQIGVQELGRKAEERRLKVGCLEAPNPSVIMTNQVIGGLMVGEARTVFNPATYGEPLNGNLKYGAGLETRWGVNPIKGSCQCAPKKQFVISKPENPADEPPEKKVMIAVEGIKNGKVIGNEDGKEKLPKPKNLLNKLFGTNMLWG